MRRNMYPVAFERLALGVAKTMEERQLKRTETILRISMRVGASVAFGAIVLAGLALMPSTGRADGHGHDDNDGIDENKALIGLRIAPVHLHMLRRDRKLVGFGSYL